MQKPLAAVSTFVLAAVLGCSSSSNSTPAADTGVPTDTGTKVGGASQRCLYSKASTSPTGKVSNASLCIDFYGTEWGTDSQALCEDGGAWADGVECSKGTRTTVLLGGCDHNDDKGRRYIEWFYTDPGATPTATTNDVKAFCTSISAAFVDSSMNTVDPPAVEDPVIVAGEVVRQKGSITITAQRNMTTNKFEFTGKNGSKTDSAALGGKVWLLSGRSTLCETTWSMDPIPAVGTNTATVDDCKPGVEAKFDMSVTTGF